MNNPVNRVDQQRMQHAYLTHCADAASPRYWREMRQSITMSTSDRESASVAGGSFLQDVDTCLSRTLAGRFHAEDTYDFVR